MNQPASCTCICHEPAVIEHLIVQDKCSPSQSASLIDEHIVALEAQMLQLRTLRNKQIPFGTLPPELLMEILKGAVVPEDNFNSPTWRSLVQLSGVCKSWRMTTLDCPSFWSCVDIIEPTTALPKILERSSPHSFALCYDQTKHRRDTILPSLSLASLVASRLDEFHVLIEMGDYIQSFVELILSQDLPKLRSLNYSSTSRFLSYNPARIPPQLSCTPKPALRHLHLDKCDINWDMLYQCTILPISDLITLSLWSPCSIPPFSLLIDLLTSSPRLRRLNLVDVIDPKAGDLRDYDKNRGKIQLRQLEAFTLCDKIDAVSDLLSWLELTPNAKLTIMGLRQYSEGVARKDTRTRCENILRASHLTTSEDPLNKTALARRTFGALRIETFSGYGDTTIRLYSDQSLSAPHSRIPSSGFPNISLELDPEPDSAPVIIGEIFAPSSQNLSIALPAHALAGKEGAALRSAWPHFFARHSTVQELYIKGDAYESIMDVLRTTQGDGSTFIPLLPCLASIVLEDVSFSPSTSSDVLRQRSRGEGGSILLAQFLATRAAAKRAGVVAVIPRVELKLCFGFNEQMLKSLRRLAEDGDEGGIFWDGQHGSNPVVDSDEEDG